MTGREIFRIWSPVGAKWTDWVRPVPFISIDSTDESKQVTNFLISDINYINKPQDNTAIILDLPHHDSIEEGIALTKFGYRPIPIYNGTKEQTGSMAVVDNHLEHALIWGALELQKIEISKESPPAFLLDSNRILQFKMDVSLFDNSWDIYDQDLPTAECFLNNGIDKIIVRSEKVQKDLSRILLAFQKKGITILFSNGYEEPRKITIRKFLQRHK